MESTENDFVVDTIGHCFLCLKQIKPISEQSVYSIQHLSRYLKLDMKKVFQGPVPQHLLEKVERSRLKVELCLDCCKLHDKLTKLFEQLERIEIEVMFRLRDISSKISCSQENGTMELIKNRNSEINAENLRGKLEIAQVLREETSKKCSVKLTGSSPIPKIRIEKTEWKKPFEDANEFDKERFLETGTQNIPTTAQIKMENHSYPKIDANETDGDDNYDFADFGAPEDDYGHLSTSSSDSTSRFQETFSVKRETVKKRKFETTTSSSSKTKSKTFSMIGNKSRNLPDVPRPIKSGPGGTISMGYIASKRIINADNGHHKCRICSKEYFRYSGFIRHFKSVHMKVSYTCPVPDCGKSFAQRIQYEIHYKSIHLGIRYRCQSCLRTFLQKSNLVRHVKMAHSKAP